jgi:hypothetical protein
MRLMPELLEKYDPRLVYAVGAALGYSRDPSFWTMNEIVMAANCIEAGIAQFNAPAKTPC